MIERRANPVAIQDQEVLESRVLQRNGHPDPRRSGADNNRFIGTRCCVSCHVLLLIRGNALVGSGGWIC